MSRPSPLFRRVGATTGELFTVTVGNQNISTQIQSISITRGGDLSSFQPATCTIETRADLPPTNGALVSVAVSAQYAPRLSTTVGRPAAVFQTRWGGRSLTTSTDYRSKKKGRTKTTLTSAAWSSVMRRHPGTFAPGDGSGFSAALDTFSRVPWAPYLKAVWKGDSDTWPNTASGQTVKPLTPGEYLSLLESRLYFLDDMTDGSFRVRSLTAWEAEAAVAASASWPLSMSHVIAPTTWEQPADFPTNYHLLRTTPTGVVGYNIGNVATDPTTELDWTDTVSTTDQWRRVYGLRAATMPDTWRMPTLVIDLGQLISSPLTNHRNAAGMLLGLSVGDPLCLGYDWPPEVSGVYIVNSLSEQITHKGWRLTVGITPYRAVAGAPSPAITPRTWDQAQGTWQAQTTAWKDA